MLKLRDDLQETLRDAIKEDEVSPAERSEALSHLAAVQHEIEALQKGS